MRFARLLRDDPVLVVGAIAIFAIAVVARVHVVRSGAGYHGNLGYDDSVYYAAADAFIHGRMPYADFVLLHPPGATLFISPFAALGTIIGDSSGFIVACVFAAFLGATNAVLVVALARRIGLHRIAALVAGLCYALYLGAVTAEYTLRLEPIGNFFVLCGLLAFFTPRRTSWLAPALCGAAFACAASVKIWWSVRLALAVLACGRRFRPLALLYAAGGAAAAFMLVDLPFFANAPRQMFDMVVRDQLGRPHNRVGAVSRLLQMSTLNGFAQHGADLRGVVYAVCACAAITIVVLAWQVPAARPVVALALIQVVTLCLVPSWFYFYPDYLAVAAMLTIGAATSRLLESRARQHARVALGFCASLPPIVLALSLLASYPADGLRVRPFPYAQQLAAELGQDKCVMSDSPMALIELNLLSRDFVNGCPDWVDDSGLTYGVDKPPSGRMNRFDDPRWQQAMRRYLSDGAAAVVMRGRSMGIDPATRRYLARYGVLANDGPIRVFLEKPLAPEQRARYG